MQPIVFRVALFRGDWDQARSQHALLWLLEALTRINQAHIRQGRALAKKGKIGAEYPPLYYAGIHYEPEPGTEEWVDIPTIFDLPVKGVFAGPWADCEDLAAYLTAEKRELAWHWARGKNETADPRYLPPDGKPTYAGWKRVKGGIKAKPFAKWRRRPDGSYGYHALCMLPDGRLEDPSLVLGMREEAAFARAGMAEKFKAKAVPPRIKFSGIPDVVVVDPEKPSGYEANIKRAKNLTGLQPTPEQIKLMTTLNGESASWGYDRGDVRRRDMERLRKHQIGMRLGRTGRTGRLGQPERSALARANAISIPVLY
jgi:hypothetical protein